MSPLLESEDPAFRNPFSGSGSGSHGTPEQILNDFVPGGPPWTFERRFYPAPGPGEVVVASMEWDFSWDWPCCGCEEPSAPVFIVKPGDIDAEDWDTCDCGCHTEEIMESCRVHGGLFGNDAG